MVWTLGVVGLCNAGEMVRVADDRQVPAQGEAEFSFTLGTVPEGQQVRLGLDARIEWQDLGGSTVAMTAYVNGRELLGRHLVNKHLVYSMRNDVELPWGAEDGAWYRLMYSADFSDRVRTDEGYEYGVPDTDPYRFVWDIGSYAQEGPNTLRVQAMQGMAFSLRLRDVVVEVGEPLPPLPPAAGQAGAAVETDPTAPLPIYVPKGVVAGPTDVRFASSGEIRFRAGAREFAVLSRTSLPDGGWTGGDGDVTWTEVQPGQTVSAPQADGALDRKVTVEADRITVADTLRNTGDTLLGAIHEVRLTLPEKPRSTYLAGNLVKRLKQRASPAHPTAMAQYEDLAVGLVAEDDVLRIQGRCSVEEGAVMLSDSQLGIPPGETRTLEWSVYAIPGGDYWDFVNAIRRHWGANATLRGPSRWVHPAGVPGTPEAARDWLGKTRMVVLCNPMFGTEEEARRGITIQHGTALPLCRGWCELSAKVATVLKEAAPEVEVFVYTHHNLCTEPGHEAKYADSRAVDVDGNVATTVYSPSPSLFVPTVTNSYGEALMGVARLIAEDLDANVYVDEITAGNVPGFGLYDSTWDGCTVAIDGASHAVTGKRSSAILLMQPWRAALMEYLRGRGKTVIANGPFYTRTMMRWGLQCFVESEPEDNGAIAAHLSHPLCLASYGSTDSRVQTGVARRLLDRAGISFAAWAVDAPLFPVTPVELRAGVVIGEERILTNRSGRFGWGDGSAAEVYVYDAEGLRVADPQVRELRQGDAVLTELRMPADHLAVLVRQRR